MSMFGITMIVKIICFVFLVVIATIVFGVVNSNGFHVRIIS